MGGITICSDATPAEKRLSPAGAFESGKSLIELNLNIEMQGVSVDIDWFRLVSGRQPPNESWHSHSGTEIHFLIDGSIEFDFSSESHILNSGEMIIIPKSQIHRLLNPSNQNYRRYVLNVSAQANEHAEGQFLFESLSIDNPVIMKIPQNVIDMLQECQDESEQAIVGYVSMIKLTLLRILFTLVREIKHYPRTDEINITKRTFANQMAERIMNYVERNVCNNITVNDISEFMHMSSKHIQRLVQREYKCTVKELVVRFRLQMAKEYLKNTQMSVSEISEIMGFSSEQSFCRFFRNAEGQSPNRYRKGFLGMN